MRKRNVRKQFWFTNEEATDLRKKASLVGLTESALVRSLLNDYQPKEKPPREFYTLITELRKIGTNLNQIAHKANITNIIDKANYEIMAKEIQQIIILIKERYL
jgi:hypothetical protein